MNAELVRIDCKGMQCPAPILAIAKAARASRGPTRLEVAADDGDFPVDVEAWCRSTGARLTSLDRRGNLYVAHLALNGAEDLVEVDQDQLATPTPPLRLVPAPPEVVRLSCVGMKCPAPILEVAKAARRHDRPTLLEVHADDCDFPVDIEAWCRSTGADLVSIEDRDGGFVATLGLHGARPVAPSEPSPPAAPALDLRGEAPAIALLKLGNAAMSGPVRFLAAAALEGQLTAWAAALGAPLQLDRVGAELRGRVHVGGPVTEATLQTPVAPSSPAPALEVGSAVAASTLSPPRENRATFLVLRNDFESLMAAFMVANATAAQGMETEIFFSFWGINVLRAEEPRQVSGLVPQAGFLQRMMKWMMPAGPDRQTMSKMHMGGVGLGMMKYFMTKQNVLSLRQLMMQASELGVKFTVCTMSMGIMGVSKADLLDLPNISFGGVTSFTSESRRSAVSMVF